MGTAYDKVMQNRKFMEEAMFGSIRDYQSLFNYKTITGALKQPYNASNNYTIKGVNAVRLMQTAVERGITDNRWMTFEQAKERGFHVKRGSTGVLCEHWTFNESATGLPKVSYYYLFNATDIEGMEPLVPEMPEVSEEYKALVEQEIESRTAGQDAGLLINLIHVFVKAKYGLLTSDYKDSEMHELSYVMKNVARDPNYIPSLIKQAQDESDAISLKIDEALITMAANNQPVPVVDDVPLEGYVEDEDEPEDEFDEEFEQRYEVAETSDAFESPYVVWDNESKDYYVEDGWIPTFETEEEAADLCAKLITALETGKKVTEELESVTTVMPDVTVSTENEANEESKENNVSVVAEENGNYVFSFTEETEQSAEIEMEPDEPEPAAKKKKAASNKKKIEDFGAKIGGARKDMWAARGLIVSDLETMNTAEAEKYVTKDNVWKKPDYEKLVEEGLPVKLAWFIKQVRDKIPAKPKYSSYELDKDLTLTDIQNEYVTFVGALRDAVMACKTADDASHLYKNFLFDGGYMKRDGTYYVSITDKAIHSMDTKLFTVLRDVSYDWQYKYDRAIKKHQFCVDADKKLPKGYAIKNNYNGTFYITKGKYIIKDGLESWEAAKSYITETVKPVSRKSAFTPPQLEHIERTGLDEIRNDIDITTEDYLTDYSFRGGEFGNWMGVADRQASLNMGYEAFYDLANALKITNTDVSFNGKLSIAFGARGHGRAAAHYEPLREVINLTKMTGAGSLAHEWGHALDDYLGKKLGYGRMLTEANAAEISEVMKAMKYRPATEEEKAAQFDSFMIDRTATVKNMLSRAVECYKIAVEVANKAEIEEASRARYASALANLQEYAKAIGEKMTEKDYASCMNLIKEAISMVRENNLYDGSLGTLGNVSSTISFQYDYAKRRENYEVETEYYKNSKAMDDVSAKCDKGYWASSCEMFARAFACYVSDKLKPGRSDYLCGHAESAVSMADSKVIRAYPVGEERKKINAAIDTLIQKMKEKELLTERDRFVRSRDL